MIEILIKATNSGEFYETPHSIAEKKKAIDDAVNLGYGCVVVSDDGSVSHIGIDQLFDVDGFPISLQFPAGFSVKQEDDKPEPEEKVSVKQPDASDCIAGNKCMCPKCGAFNCVGYATDRILLNVQYKCSCGFKDELEDTMPPDSYKHAHIFVRSWISDKEYELSFQPEEPRFASHGDFKGAKLEQEEIKVGCGCSNEAQGESKSEYEAKLEQAFLDVYAGLTNSPESRADKLTEYRDLYLNIKHDNTHSDDEPKQEQKFNYILVEESIFDLKEYYCSGGLSFNAGSNDKPKYETIIGVTDLAHHLLHNNVYRKVKSHN